MDFGPSPSTNRDITKSANFFDSLRFAIRGIGMALVREANFRRQVALFVISLLLAWWLKLGTVDIVVILLVSAAVTTLELINSAIEALADAVHPDYNAKIQSAKDMSAGAVLIVSLLALVVGIKILAPPLIIKFFSV